MAQNNLMFQNPKLKTRLSVLIVGGIIIAAAAIGGLFLVHQSIFIYELPSDPVSPTAPQGLSASPTSSIQLNWLASTDNVSVVGYRIYRCTGFSCSPATLVGSTRTTSYLDINLIPLTAYTYAVSAYDAANNESRKSNSVTETNPLDTTPPTITRGQPTGTLSAGTIRTTMSVDTSENATCGYSTTAGQSYPMPNTFTTTGGTNHSTIITGLQDGQGYDYYLRCIDASGNANTNDYNISFDVASSGGDTIPPTIPTNLSATAISSSQINLSWSASTDNVGVTGYNIYRGNIQVATAVGTSYSDTGLSPSTTYTYKISAFDAADNESDKSTPDSATTQSPPPPVSSDIPIPELALWEQNMLTFGRQHCHISCQSFG